MIQQAPIQEQISSDSPAWIRWFNDVFRSLQGVDVEKNTPINETLTFGGGASGEVATITFTNGIITSRTLVP